MPKEWIRFYEKSGQRLSQAVEQHVVGAFGRKSESFSFDSAAGLTLYGRGEVVVECWVEDHRKMTRRIRMGTGRPEFRLVAVPESWIRKQVTVRDALRRGVDAAFAVRMTKPFRREFGHRALGQFTVKYPDGDSRYDLKVRSRELGRASITFSREELADPVSLELGGVEVRLQFVDAATGKPVTPAQIKPRVDSARGRWDKAGRYFRFDGVAPGAHEVVLLWTRLRTTTRVPVEFALDPSRSHVDLEVRVSRPE